MEEHLGRLVLDDAPEDFAGGLGARVRLEFEPLTAVSTTEVRDTINA
jgi:nitrogen fixation/metabolism regulation signal transduction histidine kinase